jgi:hypothetical protein
MLGHDVALLRVSHGCIAVSPFVLRLVSCHCLRARAGAQPLRPACSPLPLPFLTFLPLGHVLEVSLVTAGALYLATTAVLGPVGMPAAAMLLARCIGEEP